MAKRIWNFNAGPATLPLPVLEIAKADLPDYDNTGMAVMELSHRSKQYDAIHMDALSLMRDLFGVPDNFSFVAVICNLYKRKSKANDGPA